ncbi:CS1 type fimbrial major subunit [Enterobacter roggenkampii]|nr:CS1 type fimbrial major subunit [Enterobacter roggenkampii]
MRKYFKPLMIVAAMTTSVSALAIQKDITVNASVDSQLDMTQADNTPLPASIDMQYLPGRGLESYRLNTKVWSKEGANKRGNSSRLTQSFHFFMFEPIFSPVNALNQPI